MKNLLPLHPQNVLWCNGSTTVFGSVSGGSSPPGTTIKARKQYVYMLAGFCFVLFYLSR